MGACFVGGIILPGLLGTFLAEKSTEKFKKYRMISVPYCTPDLREVAHLLHCSMLCDLAEVETSISTIFLRMFNLYEVIFEF
ncbi:hypothetical protein CRP01_05725 [Flavilitoribacter nigricans DSM 23189 = NBRC 102662]|uniref:Uncharacterized protein n=1 Tax=Flavilitoribacter nigricans (strain ATCC 23147 / DSM 23189 / NBRC 102662 / NCIMB 1420 / SS-2) TaxID=1122177 RepID=A0A2D0NHF0_FLAN2|nr:hypothetical protein CRP01_05725 [Flavilitoribacter nigricans DSM 23189 = NBRC 102662]